MPRLAPRICQCGNAVPVGTQCQCRIAARAESNARYEATRPTARERGYTSAWDKARAGFLAKHDTCTTCPNPATLVDHIIPHKGDKSLFWDRSNWQPLCTSCHSGKKQRLERSH